jgi:hypothetical protein
MLGCLNTVFAVLLSAWVVNQLKYSLINAFIVYEAGEPIEIPFDKLFHRL